MGLNILVLNLTRMGDLIQTTPLIRGLREQEPGCRITMLANAKFTGILKFVEGIDELVTFDPHQFGDKGGEKEVDILQVYDYLDSLCAELNARKFDRIINLSHSKLSAVLSLLINAPDSRGFLSTPRGERLIRHPWLVYFTSFLAFRKYNRFNLVDMYMRGAGVTPGQSTRLLLKPDEAELEKTNKIIESAGVKPGDLLVGLQAGASREDRRWNPKSFAAAGDHLAKKYGAKIVLFGAASEKKLGDEVEAVMESPAINLIGKTNLSELVGWTKRLNLLITNDTGTMHIAAALGTPIVALFFVHARCEETGPYCDGAIILQSDISCAPCTHQTVCDHYSCLRYITPEDVIAASESVLEKSREPLTREGVFQRVLLYTSQFHEDGGIEFAPARRVPLTSEELFAYLYRPIFSHALEHWENPSAKDFPLEEAGREIENLLRRFDSPAQHDLDSWFVRATEGADKLIAMAEKVVEIAALMKKGGSVDKLQKHANDLAAADVEVATLADTHEALAPLCHVYRRRVENFEGEDHIKLVEQAAPAGKWLGMATRSFMSAVEIAGKKIRGAATAA